ncbi:MAG TPA: hypothetical protein PKW06_13285, partial [Cyclobacteriaceae bacterium]|nr:hypothetical protein [Cyclobacteriaceae bacterium]
APINRILVFFIDFEIWNTAKRQNPPAPGVKLVEIGEQAKTKPLDGNCQYLAANCSFVMKRNLPQTHGHVQNTSTRTAKGTGIDQGSRAI